MQDSSSSMALSTSDILCLQANLGMGGCVVSVHEPIEAAAWIENNWEDPLLASIQDSGCCGPVPFMLFPTKPALAIFGGAGDPFLKSAAESLAKLSGFHVVIQPAGENPMGTSCVLQFPSSANNLCYSSSSHGTQLGNVLDQGSQTEANNARQGYRDPMGGDRSEGTAGGSDESRRGGDDGGTGSDKDDSDPTNTHGQHPNRRWHLNDNGGGDGGDGGGGPTAINDNWESHLHQTSLNLDLKLSSHTYAISIGYNFKFKINRETDLPIDLENLGRSLSQPEVIALVDFEIETRPRETRVDRSYANIGFVAHREQSIMQRKFLPRGFDLPEKLYKHGQQHEVQKGINTALGFSQGAPLATATFSYNSKHGSMVEATDSKALPRCRVDHEIGERWNKDARSYTSYNIAYQPQDMRLDVERSESHPLEVKVGMGINLRPSGAEAPLPRISFINRNQVLIWVADPTCKARVRGIVVLMSSYLDNIRTEEKLSIYEQEEVDLTHTGTSKLLGNSKSFTQKEESKPGTISLSIAKVERAPSSSKFGAFITRLGQRSSTPMGEIPPHEFLARGWDAENNQWRSVLWPALDQHFRAADLEQTQPAWKIQWKTTPNKMIRGTGQTTGSGIDKGKGRC
ncbi:hypothetical protein C8R44DRAFT_779029 [Mycena epipterygia]|nr:hypothetical protein C8R44DRAFT_779029 [Mycena epipterygia]